MASPLKQEDRLDELAAQVKKLRIDVVDLEREAGELLEPGLVLDDESGAVTAGTRADAARMLLKATLDLYFDASERARRRVGCTVHGDAIFVACPDCRERMPKKRAA